VFPQYAVYLHVQTVMATGDQTVSPFFKYFEPKNYNIFAKDFFYYTIHTRISHDITNFKVTGEQVLI
jgi:hypothetical protein